MTCAPGVTVVCVAACIAERSVIWPPASNAEPVAGATAMVSPLEVKVKLIAAAGRTSKDSTAASATSQELPRAFKGVPWRMGWVADGGEATQWAGGLSRIDPVMCNSLLGIFVIPKKRMQQLARY